MRLTYSQCDNTYANFAHLLSDVRFRMTRTNREEYTIFFENIRKMRWWLVWDSVCARAAHGNVRKMRWWLVWDSVRAGIPVP